MQHSSTQRVALHAILQHLKQNGFVGAVAALETEAQEDFDARVLRGAPDVLLKALSVLQEQDVRERSLRLDDASMARRKEQMALLQGCYESRRARDQGQRPLDVKAAVHRVSDVNPSNLLAVALVEELDAVAVGCASGTVALVSCDMARGRDDGKQGKVLCSIGLGKSPVLSVVYNARDRLLCCGNMSGTVTLLKIVTRAPERKEGNQESRVSVVAPLLVEIGSMRVCGSFLTHLRWSPCGSFVAVAAHEPVMRVLRVSREGDCREEPFCLAAEHKHTLSVHGDSYVEAVCWRPSSTGNASVLYFVRNNHFLHELATAEVEEASDTGGKDFTVKSAYNLNDHDDSAVPFVVLDMCCGALSSSSSFSSSSSSSASSTGNVGHDLEAARKDFVFLATDSMKVVLYDLRSQSALLSYHGVSNGPLSCPRLALSRDMALLFVTSDADRRILAFDVFTGESVVALENIHKANVRDIVYDDNRDKLIAVSYDRSISVSTIFHSDL